MQGFEAEKKQREMAEAERQRKVMAEISQHSVLCEYGTARVNRWKSVMLRRKIEQKENFSRLTKDLHGNKQKGFLSVIVGNNRESLRLFKTIPAKISSVNYVLAEAEKDFNERAYAPFWDSIEQAITELRELDERIKAVIANAFKDADARKNYEKMAPPFPINTHSLPELLEAESVIAKFKTIVRRAQSDFQFAVIFEQRKTNRILVAGFTNLAQAINGLEDCLDSSIRILNCQISQMSSEVRGAIENVGEKIVESVDKVDESIQKVAKSVKMLDSNLEKQFTDLHEAVGEFRTNVQQDAEEQAERDTKTLEMLDNIQNRRKP